MEDDDCDICTDPDLCLDDDGREITPPDHCCHCGDMDGLDSGTCNYGLCAK